MTQLSDARRLFAKGEMGMGEMGMGEMGMGEMGMGEMGMGEMGRMGSMFSLALLVQQVTLCPAR
ncbi:MAG: hypothetical protein PHO37_01105 [Kiritimatiellae bacterium]|nr:hypothetical protein [Kiritimatiellia bacterium]